MKIISLKPLSMAEVKEIPFNAEEKKNLTDYIKKFCKTSNKDAEKIYEEIEALKNLKIKKEHIAKMIDFLPRNSEELNRIFSDISLDEKETNEILEIIKKY